MSAGPDQQRDAANNESSAQQKKEEFKNAFAGMFSQRSQGTLDPEVVASIQKKIDQGRKRGVDSQNQEVQTAHTTGFTKPSVYPEEVSKFPLDMSKRRSVNTPTMDEIRKRKVIYYVFEDYAGEQFTHLLDYFSDQKNGLGDERVIPSAKYEDGKLVDYNPNDIYLGSFIKTITDNEDPTYLGFDLKIKEQDSPLFNGMAKSFINQFAGYGNSEIESRLDILDRFQKQIRRFLRTDVFSETPQYKDSTGKFADAHGVKTYYMKKITGLNNLVESFDSAEGKQFVDYGKDFITLTFNEDVTQNIGYLAHLYKLLSYSRLNGKLILPPNVLRFDVELEITEVRKLNRYYKQGFLPPLFTEESTKTTSEGTIVKIADRIAKYTYTLYDCEFFFKSLPHGDSLDMSAIAEVTDYEVKFNYKFATSKFTRFSLTSDLGVDNFTHDKLDNKLIRPSKILPNETKMSRVGNPHIYNEADVTRANVVSLTTKEETIIPAAEIEGELQATKEAAESGNNKPPEPTELITDTTNTTVAPVVDTGSSINEQLTASSIQKALDRALITGPIGDKINKALVQVNKSIAFPEIKGFALGLLGGGLSKVANDFISNPTGVAKGFLQGKLDQVTSTIINPITKGFNLNILGGELGGSLGSLGSLGKNLLGGGAPNLKQKLNDIFTGTIAPKIKGFATGLLSGGLLKTSGIVNNLGLPKNLIAGLNKIASTTIAPAIKGFNLGMIGGALAGPGGLKKAASSIKQNLEKAKNNLIDSGIKTINKSLLSQASLLNKTLGNIIKQKGSSVKSQLTKNVVGAAKNFVGKSLKSFFTK